MKEILLILGLIMGFGACGAEASGIKKRNLGGFDDGDSYENSDCKKKKVKIVVQDFEFKGAENPLDECFEEIMERQPKSAQGIYEIVRKHGDDLAFMRVFYDRMYDELSDYDHLLAGVQGLIHENFIEIEEDDAGDYAASRYNNGVFKDKEDNSSY